MFDILALCNIFHQYKHHVLLNKKPKISKTISEKRLFHIFIYCIICIHCIPSYFVVDSSTSNQNVTNRLFNGRQIDNGVAEKGKSRDFRLNCDWSLTFSNLSSGRLNDSVVFLPRKGQISAKSAFSISFHFGIYCLEDIKTEWKGDLHTGLLGGV